MDSPSRWRSGAKRGLLVYLPTILGILGFAYLFDAPEHLYRATRRSEPSYHHHPLSGILSRRSIDALESDQQLLAAYTSALSAAVASVSDLASRFPDVPQISTANDILSSHYSTFSVSSPSSSSSPKELGKRDGFSDLFSPITDLFGGITKGISLQGPAFFLGIGLGEGASQGLNLSSADVTKQVANRVIAENNETSSGLNPALQDAAKGAAATLLGSVDIGSLLSTEPGQISKIAFSLAEGLGNGTASGLGLSERAKILVPPAGTEIPDVVGTFGFALSKSVASNVDIPAAGSVDIDQLLGGVGLGAVAMVAGEGIGNGTATGLGLSEHGVPPTTGNTVVDAVGGFAYGLSKSLAGGVDLQNGFSLAGGNGTAGGFDIMSMLPSAAMGLGRGLSEGVGIGLGVEADVPMPMQELPDGQIDIGGATRNFARGFAAGLLENGTAMKIVGSLGSSDNGTGGGGLGGMDIGKVAQGFARGMLQGVGDGIDSVGGVQAIVDGTAALPADMGNAMNISLDFDDSINGAASGMGLGLGNQGVFVVTQVVQNMKQQAGSRAATRQLLLSRGVDEEANDMGLVPRQEETENPATGTTNIPFLNGTLNLNVSNIITADAVTAIAQGAVDALTCQGIGGFASIGSGLLKSGVISLDSFDTGNNSAVQMLKQVIPDSTVTITNEGNTFGINMKQGINGDLSAITINKTAVAKFVAFLIVHILFAIIIFLNAMPAAIGLEGSRNILDRLKKPYVLPNSRRWTNLLWVFLILPGTILVLLFGVLAMGSATHFRTAHGVFGIITTVAAVAGTVLHYLVIMRTLPDSSSQSISNRGMLRTVRNILNQVLLLLAAVATFTGFGDLASISICLVHVVGVEMGIMAGFALAGLWTIGQAISGLDGYLVFRERKGTKKDGGKGREEEEVGEKRRETPTVGGFEA